MDGRVDGRVEGPSATFPHGRGPDGYTATAEGWDTATAEGWDMVTVEHNMIPTSVRGSLGSRDGGGPAPATTDMGAHIHRAIRATDIHSGPTLPTLSPTPCIGRGIN